MIQISKFTRTTSIMELHNAPAWMVHCLYKAFIEEVSSEEGQKRMAGEEMNQQLEEALGG